MLTLFKNLFGDKSMFRIIKNIDNRFYLLDRKGNLAGNSSGYTRKRDAVRGANRNGLSLA